MFDLASHSSTSIKRDRFITGETPISTDSVKLAPGNYQKYSVMGVVSATGLSVLSDADANDGSQIPDHILIHAVETTEVVDAPAYMNGCFNPDMMVYGNGHDSNTVKKHFRDKNIFLKKPL